MISIVPKFHQFLFTAAAYFTPIMMILVEAKNYGRRRVKYLFLVARKLSVWKAAYELQMR